MPIFLQATPELGVETTQDMSPGQPGDAVNSGIARASLTVYAEGEPCSETLPTVGDLLGDVDPKTGLLHLDRFTGIGLAIDAAPLRDLPRGLRVSPGYGFITHEARRAAAETKV